MPEETTAIKCKHCAAEVVQLGTAWMHNPRPGIYKAACRSAWGHLAVPEAPNAQ